METNQQPTQPKAENPILDFAEEIADLRWVIAQARATYHAAAQPESPAAGATQVACMRLVYYATAQMARLKRLAQPAMPTAAKGKRWGPEPELRTREVATPLHPAPSTAQTPPANTHTEGTPQQQTQDGFLAKVTGKRPAPEVTRALLQAKVDDLLAKLQADASLTNPAGTAELLHTLGAERLPRSPSPPHSDSSGSPYYDWLPGDETWGIPDDT